MLVSMTAFWDIIEELLNLTQPTRLVEIGGDQGKFTEKLCAWAKPRQASVHVIETQPTTALKQIIEHYPFATLHVGRSLEILPRLDRATGFVIDGDHNYYTVYNELQLITHHHTPQLILFHDVGWPWGRRDMYYDPNSIPEDQRQAYVTDPQLGILPGQPGVVSQKGLRSQGRFAFAKVEGGAHNGVLTAVQDFLSENSDYQLFTIECVFGLGILVPKSAPYYTPVVTALRPYVGNPMINLLEADRLQTFLHSLNQPPPTPSPVTPSAKDQTGRSAYVDLMKRTLLDLIYSEPTDLVVSPRRQTMSVAEARQTGRDWPERGLTMIGLERLNHLQVCVEDVLQRGVPGDFIETGVWRGGSCIFMRSLLKAYEVTDRTVWVADSFQGLPKPDVEHYPLDKKLDLTGRRELAVSRAEVARNFKRFGLLDNQVQFLEGWFKDTLAAAPIKQLAVLRLDGDLYQSTMEALVALYPKLIPGGYLIIDDYGCVGPCRQAVNDYRQQHGITEEIQKIDWTGVYWQRALPSAASAVPAMITTPPEPSRLTQALPLISVVIVVHNMQRAAPRTLQSLTAAYQGVSPDTYEVIVVENGSDQPLSKEQVEAFGPNFRYVAFPEASPSPVKALNFGVRQAQGQMVGLMIDGARILTPGVLRYACRALQAYTNPVVSTLAWHLGSQLQRHAIQNGYSEQVEDDLLQQIGWPTEGYKLFDISTLAGASLKGWFLPIQESNCIFLLRRMYETLGGFDEQFDRPGGGFVNMDFYYRVCEHPSSELIVLLGEGSFHQIHGGIATNNADEQASQANDREWREQYKTIRGVDFEPSPRQPDYWGHLPSGAMPFLYHSLQISVEEHQRAVALLSSKLEDRERVVARLNTQLEERERAVASLNTQLQEQTQGLERLQQEHARAGANLRQELQATAAELEGLRHTKFFRVADWYWRWRHKLKTTTRLTKK